MKKLLCSLLIVLSIAFTVQSQTPAITMTTTTAVGSTFSINIGATASSTPIQVDWGNGTLVNYTIGTTTSTLSSTLGGSTVKVYGAGISFLDVSSKNLTALDVSGATAITSLRCYANQLNTLDVSKNTALTNLDCLINQLTELDVSKNTVLRYLHCYSNQLTALDVSKNTALTYLQCSSNHLTALDVSKNTTLTSLDCSSNHLTALDVSKNTTLTSLDCSSNQLTALDVSKNTTLTSLDCSSNQLTVLDVSKNTALKSLLCYSNPLTTLNVSNNTALTSLSCYSNQLTALDVSKNTALTYLQCSSNQLTALDVSKNTALTYLQCSSNQLTVLDVSKNTVLNYLNCSSNQLTALDVSKNMVLTDLRCSLNRLSIGTLPIKQPAWTTYYYSPQEKLKLPKTKYAINEIIDLSSQLSTGGNTTAYIWKTAGGATLAKGVDYSEDNGQFTFPTVQGDNLYCQMTNASFPDITLITENISVTSTAPAITMTTTTAVGSTFSIIICATASSTPIQVDWGNGTLVDYTVGTLTSTISGTLGGSTVKVYGAGISSLNVSSKNLTALDVSGATALTFLYCDSNQLTTLDVSNNTALTILDCDSNRLTFTTLPIKQTTWVVYFYYSQARLNLPKKNYILSETIDLSSQLTANGNTTAYTWKTKGGAMLASGVDFTANNGVFTFIKAQTDSVYCQMTNAAFSGLTLSTSNVKITQFPSSIEEINLSGKIYPNPVRDLLHVECEGSISRVQVFTVYGAKAYEQAGNGTSTLMLPTTSLPKGLLIVKVFGRNGVMERKIVKE